MGNKLYVGNLSWNTTDSSLESAFAQAGAVTSAKIIVDRETNKSKGFGFVEMPNDDEAQNAINELNGANVSGRTIVVNKSEPRPEGERRSFDRNRTGGGRPGGGYGNDRGGFNRGGGNRNDRGY